MRRRADHRHAAVHPRRRDYFKTDFFNAIGVELPFAGAGAKGSDRPKADISFVAGYLAVLKTFI